MSHDRVSDFPLLLGAELTLALGQLVAIDEGRDEVRPTEPLRVVTKPADFGYRHSGIGERPHDPRLPHDIGRPDRPHARRRQPQDQPLAPHRRTVLQIEAVSSARHARAASVSGPICASAPACARTKRAS